MIEDILISGGIGVTLGFAAGLLVGRQLVENLREALSLSRAEIISEKARAENFAAQLRAAENRVVSEAKSAINKEVDKL